MRKAPVIISFGLILAAFAAAPLNSAEQPTPKQQAARILEASGVKGGFIVHLGCGEGKLTAALRASDAYLVHGLDADAANVEKARGHIRSLGIYGPVCVDRLRGGRLPYIDNLVNLVVAEDPVQVPMDEVMRVLCPEGVAYIKRGGTWTRTVKPRPKEIDEWTHNLHDATGNAVSHDEVVGPPRRMQWVGSPKYSRHHDRMSSVSAVVSSGGRVFYITDEASCLSILIPPRWTLIARDAFNGTILWKQRISNWHTHLWPLKSGPAQLARRLVAQDDRVYVTLGLDAPITALDAVTGKIVRTYEETKATEEVVCSDGVLFALVNPRAEKPEYADMERIKTAFNGPFWDEGERRIMALNGESGEVLWTTERTVLPATLAADQKHVYFHDGESVVCLDRNTGGERWRSDPVGRSEIIPSFYLPILVVYKDVVLFSGGETAGTQTGSWYMSGEDTMTALSAETGKVLWTAYHPPSGYRSPEDLLVANGLVWTGETTSGRAEGVFVGRDPHTGEVKSEFAPDVETYWFHHRCYRGKATDKYLIVSRTGTEFIDVENKKWHLNHWVRGACLYGVMPANGLLYAPQHPCACYLEAKLYGFCALAPAAAGPAVDQVPSGDVRLEQGPAFGLLERQGAGTVKDGDWPTFRHDPERSGSTKTPVPPRLKQAWRESLGGRLTQPVVSGGRLYVASVDSHTVHALDADSGKRLWWFTAGGRIDSPPTIHDGGVYFGSVDGWVYCLRASDGVLAWRFRAAPMDRRQMAFEQLESLWPVHGSVLVQKPPAAESGHAELWFVAGRSMFLDGGLYLWRLDPGTGRVLSKTVMDGHGREGGKDLHDYVSWLNMPTGLPDILSSDGRLVYMRSQPFNSDGTRPPLEPMRRREDADEGAPLPTQNPELSHLFCPTGFLDDTWWHRTYWLYGSEFISGYSGYYLAGKVAPAGRILVFDDSKVYGFGRKPKFYRWTTPIEHQLFAADKITGGSDLEGSLIIIDKSKSLNPAGTPLTVEAHVKAETRGGVILANGGNIYGYALYLQDGKPYFAVRINGEVVSIGAKAELPETWVHLAGVLTEGKELKLYVDGKLAGLVKAPGFIDKAPAEGLVVGADENSCVADYEGPFPFKGLIDEVRIYSRALAGSEIAGHARVDAPSVEDREGLALWYAFEEEGARDTSDKGNHGKPEGVALVEGRVRKAMRFTGKVRPENDYKVQHHWTMNLPHLARSLCRAGDYLFLAGPPDLIDEEQVFDQIDDPRILESLVEQAASINGRRGAVLLAVSANDGKEVARNDLAESPVFDGMIAANKKLYMASVDGSVVCLEGSDL